MNLFLKIIACLSVPYVLFACEEKVVTTDVNEPVIKEERQVQKEEKKLTLFELEVQKMLTGKEADEAILRKFLKGKAKELNGDFVKQGLEYYVAKHGERPDKRFLIKAVNTLGLLHEKMRGEVALEKIEQQLSEQLNKE